MPEAPFSIVRGPPGSFVAEWLAAAVTAWERWPSCVWLRVSTSHPARLAESLVGACEHRWADPGSPVPTVATPAARLAETIRRAPAGATVVIEVDGRLPRGFGSLVAGIRPIAADRGLTLVAVTETRVPRPLLESADCVVPATGLGGPTVVTVDPRLPAGARPRLLRMAGRSPAILNDALDAAETWRADGVVAALERSPGIRVLLNRLTSALLPLCSPAQREALAACLATGYWHPCLGTTRVSAAELRPWVVPLEQDWGWLRPIWRGSLRRFLDERAAERWTPPGRSRLLAAAVPAPAQVAAAANGRGAGPGLMEVRLLGGFELRVDGAVVPWTGQRGVSVLRYLLARPGHACSRDGLIEEFWPDTEPPVARNRLQVAVSGLRHGLRQVTDRPVIEYSNGGYRINSATQLSVDVERFEGALAAGRTAEHSGRPAVALSAYREAVELYRGDFAADAPFEGWTMLPRESLRLAYLDALDRTNRILLGTGRLDDCIATAHRMLDVDPCREDAHRLLMRCYAKQGRPYLAIRQYELCRAMLGATLDSTPGPETVRLYEMVRAGAGPHTAR